MKRKNIPNPGKEGVYKIHENQLPKPLSIKEQWSRVHKWNDFLNSDEDSSQKSLLTEPIPISQLFDYKKTNSDLGVLDALFSNIELGFVPDRSLLLVIYECWMIYINSHGEISLEEAFFGKPIKSVGNYAGRKYSENRKLIIKYQFQNALRENGGRRMKAAEKVSEDWGGQIEPESILRMMRGVTVDSL